MLHIPHRSHRQHSQHMLKDKFCVVRVVPNPQLPLACNCCRNNRHKSRAHVETGFVCVCGGGALSSIQKRLEGCGPDIAAGLDASDKNHAPARPLPASLGRECARL